VDKAAEHIVFSLAGQLYAVDIDDSSSVGIEQLEVPGPVIDPRISPDGGHVAWHAQGRLWTANFDGEEATAVTPDDGAVWGLADFIAAEELDRHRGFWWSPQSDRLLVSRVDDSEVARWWLADPSEPAQSPAEHAYPAAGQVNASVSLWLVSREASPTCVLSVGPREDDEYCATVRWQQGDPLALTLDRSQRRASVFALGPAGARIVTRWHDDEWVDVIAGTPRWSDAGELLTVRRDATADRLRLFVDDVPVSPADLQVRSLLDSGAGRHALLVSATGTTSQVAIVGPTGTRVLTSAESDTSSARDGAGWHAATAQGDLLVQTWARLGDERWRTDVLRADEAGEWLRLATIRSLAADTGPTSVEVMETGGIRIAIIRPLRPVSEPLPILLLPYGGPHGQRVIAAGPAYAEAQWWADQGFVVVVADGRGTPGVSPSWERAVAGDLAGPVLSDQLTALDAAIAHCSDGVDAQRVGMTGWSFGGFLSALAVLRAPDRIHAAVAGAPVTDWHLYDTAYTERYLGLPQENSESYSTSSLLPNPGPLRRPLLLIHGLVDDNVVAAHTLRLSEALLAQGDSHDVLPLPGITHMAAKPDIAANLLRIQLQFFQQALQA